MIAFFSACNSNLYSSSMLFALLPNYSWMTGGKVLILLQDKLTQKMQYGYVVLQPVLARPYKTFESPSTELNLRVVCGKRLGRVTYKKVACLVIQWDIKLEQQIDFVITYHFKIKIELR